MDINFNLHAPLMPNFIQASPQVAFKTREEREAATVSIPVGTLSQEQAEQYAEIMKKEFLKHWEMKNIIERANNYKPPPPDAKGVERYKVNILKGGKEIWVYCTGIERAYKLKEKAVSDGISSIIYERKGRKYVAIT